VGQGYGEGVVIVSWVGGGTEAEAEITCNEEMKKKSMEQLKSFPHF
jgi:hypothetical protein